MLKSDVLISPLAVDSLVKGLSATQVHDDHEEVLFLALRELIYHVIMSIGDLAICNIYLEVFVAATDRSKLTSLYSQIKKDAGL